MKVNKKTYFYTCEETLCEYHKDCGYGTPHVCKKSHVHHYCWRLRKEIGCIPSSKKIVYTRCSESQTCTSQRNCGWTKPSVRTTFPSSCPYDRHRTISFEPYDIDLIGKTPENEYLKRMGY